MPRKKAEVVEEKREETLDVTQDEVKEAVLSDSDEKSAEGTDGESNGEETPQTGMANQGDKETASAGAKDGDENFPDESQSNAEAAQEIAAADDGEEILQTDSEKPDEKVYPPEDALAHTINPENQNQSDTEGQNQKAQVPGEGIRRRRAGKSTGSVRLGSSQVLAIDGHLVAETEAEKARNDLLDLMESQKTGRILTGTIQGVERQESGQNRSLAVIYHGEFKVIIPAEEAVEPPEDLPGQDSGGCVT